MAASSAAASSAAASSADIEQEIQRLEARLQRMRKQLVDVMVCLHVTRKRRKDAAKRDQPRDVLRRNQRICVLQRLQVKANLLRQQLSDQLAVLKQQAQ